MRRPSGRMVPRPKASSSVGIDFMRLITSVPEALAAAAPMSATAFR